MAYLMMSSGHSSLCALLVPIGNRILEVVDAGPFRTEYQNISSKGYHSPRGRPISSDAILRHRI